MGAARVSRPAEIKALGGVRALPAVMIVLFHYCTFHGYVPGAAVLGQPVMKGYLWVEFFFALSGFILIHVYGARWEEFRRGGGFVDFLKARLARLYPLHLFTLCTILLLIGVLNGLADAGGYTSIYRQPGAPIHDWPSLGANLLLIQAWNIVPGLSWNAVAWFVSVEFLLCLLFPVYLLLSRGGWGRGVLLILAGVAWLLVLEWNSGVGLDITFTNGMFRGMAGFGIGVGLAMLHRAAMRGGAERVPDWAFSAAQAAVLAFLVWAIAASGAPHTRADIWTAVALAALVLALAFDRGFLAKFFALPLLRRLGEWSFGIYMGQMFWMQIVQHLEYRRVIAATTPAARWIEMIAVLLVCVAWGALLARFVELPAAAALKRWFAQRKGTA